MEEAELKGKVQHIVDKLRQITTLVQLAPFVLTFIYFIVFGLYFILPDILLNVIDTLFYTSPIVALLLLAQSKILCLCKWHRTACLLPIVPHAFSAADYTLIVFSNDFARIVIASTIAMAILLLIAAYKIFIKPDR